MTEQGDRLGTQWVKNPDGEVIMGMKEDSEGRAVIDCTILLPNRAAFLAEVVEARGETVGNLVEDLVEVKKEKKEEAFVTALKLEGLDVEDLADVEVATFLAAEGDGDPPTDGVGEGVRSGTLVRKGEYKKWKEGM